MPDAVLKAQGYQDKWNKAHVLDVLVEVKTLAGKYKQK